MVVGLSANHQLEAAWVDEALSEFAARLVGGARLASCSRRKIDLPPDSYTSFDEGCGSYREAVYRRGSRMLYAVRDRIGESKLMGCLRTGLQADRFAPMDGARLADVLEACDPAVRAIIAPYLSTTTLDPVP